MRSIRPPCASARATKRRRGATQFDPTRPTHRRPHSAVQWQGLHSMVCYRRHTARAAVTLLEASNGGWASCTGRRLTGNAGLVPHSPNRCASVLRTQPQQHRLTAHCTPGGPDSAGRWAARGAYAGGIRGAMQIQQAWPAARWAKAGLRWQGPLPGSRRKGRGEAQHLKVQPRRKRTTAAAALGSVCGHAAATCVRVTRHRGRFAACLLSGL